MKRPWSTGNVLKIAAIVLGALVLMRFLWFARNIFLVTFLGVAFGLALGKAVDFFERRLHMKRGIAAALIVLVSLGAVVGVGAMVAPSLKRQMSELSQKLPTLLDQVEAKLGTDPVQLTKDALSGVSSQSEQSSTAASADKPPEKPPEKPGQPAQQQGLTPPAASQQQNAQQQAAPQPRQQQPQPGANQQQGAPDQQQQGGSGAEQAGAKRGGLRENIGGQLQSLSKIIFPFLSSTLSAIAALVFMIFIAMYIASEPRLYKNGLLLLFPPERREHTSEVLSEVGHMLRSWLVARLIAMVVIGLVTGGVLALLKVPAAGALGIIAGLLEFIPLFGPIAASVPAIGMGLIESPTTALWVAIAFVVIQQFEGNVLTPMLMQKRIEVPAAVVIVSVAALGVLFGVLGMLIAEPLSAVAILLMKRLWVKDAESSPAAPEAEN